MVASCYLRNQGGIDELEIARKNAMILLDSIPRLLMVRSGSEHASFKPKAKETATDSVPTYMAFQHQEIRGISCISLIFLTYEQRSIPVNDMNHEKLNWFRFRDPKNSWLIIRNITGG